MNDFIKGIRHSDFVEANITIQDKCGIIDFFNNQPEMDEFVVSHESEILCANEDRVSYGDWQTPSALSSMVCMEHFDKYGSPDIIIEPTCGLGSFVLSAIDTFKNVSEIHAIEINSEYVKKLKFHILNKFIVENKQASIRIHIYNADIFSFNFSNILNKIKSNNWKLSIIGNPPWVTNSKQGRNNSSNLPQKSNALNLRGIDAITGKSNFDISEYVTLHLLSIFDKCNGAISFLLKNSVIRNIINKQKDFPRFIGNISQNKIDASKEFDVAVEASCLNATLNCKPDILCNVFDFYDKSLLSSFGWHHDFFVSDLKKYLDASTYDGKSDLVWRSGIKHDCAAVLELTYNNGLYVNGLGEQVDIEPDLIYPLLKSSDIQNKCCNKYRKYIVLPQKRTGENTASLQQSYPKTYLYLQQHVEFFRKRKSSIYLDKDIFSIFGIGDYSFMPYKVVVSSLYKNVEFQIIKPYNHKPIMVDDTCYQLGFRNYEDAEKVYECLRSKEIINLIESLVFSDSKRVVTKGLLMRINIMRYLKDHNITLCSENSIKNPVARQLSLF
ncbi:MAG: SAM-dependent methyltransferase [Muribaculum sp.]|nr:SAM-dependent methyltransferase [Muribaculum sp.]